MAALTDPPPPGSRCRSWPTLATVALGLLVAGTALGAMLVFGRRTIACGAQEARSRLAPATRAFARRRRAATSHRASPTPSMRWRVSRTTTNALETVDRTRRQLRRVSRADDAAGRDHGYAPELQMADETRHADSRAVPRIVEEETERLEHIVGDLLDLAKLGGGGSFRVEDVQVAPLLERIRPGMGRSWRRSDSADTVERRRGSLCSIPPTLEALISSRTLPAHAARGRIISLRTGSRAGARKTVEDTTGILRSIFRTCSIGL